MNGLIRSALLFISSCAMVPYTYAQDILSDTSRHITHTAPVKVAPKGPKPVTNEVSFGFRVHTNGWSTYMDLGKVKAQSAKQADMFSNVNFWQLEFSEKKSPKQQKLEAQNNSTGSSSSYVYGKINNFYALKVGYGIRKLLAGKPDPGSVSIHWVNVVSGSLGMLKPYYLNLTDGVTYLTSKYTEETKSLFLNQRQITGSAGFGQGLSEMKMIPGGHLKSMLHFDCAANRKSVVAVEVGASVDYYAEPINIMANQPAQPYFVDLFVAFQFGKRW